MSFKRADDVSQSLHELRRRRVSDLLREDVADDEVSRLSNGRLTCLVCHHRPIFDTLDMFYVHRQGKKHTQNAAYQAVEKQELHDLIIKRQHEQFVKTGNTNIQQAQVPAPRGLGPGKPYDPRTKKQTKPFDRKPTVDIGGVTSDVASPVESTSTAALPGNRNGFSAFNKKPRICLNTNTSTSSDKYSASDDSQGKKYPERGNDKNFGQSSKNQERSNEINFGKMKSKDKTAVRLSQGDNSILHSKGIGKFITKVNQGQDSSHYFVKRKRLKADNAMKLETGPSRLNTVSNSSVSETKSTVDWEKFQKYKVAIMSGSSKPIPDKRGKQMERIVKPDPTILDTEQTGNAIDKSSNTRTEIASDNKNSDTHKCKRAQAERELQLRGAGWKRDWTGKWVRDQDAEFDSDEETPDFQ